MNSMKRKIDFLVAGTQKGGTSALDHYLRQHPNICMGRKKELHFFDNDGLFAGPTVDYSILENQFDPSETAMRTGESTPVYLFWNPCMERIHAYNQHMQLIVILRNPIQRAFSHWNMEVSRATETEPFLRCIQNEITGLQERHFIQNRSSYLERGFYSHQIERVFLYFPPEQVCFIKYEVFKMQQEETIHQILRFLGLDTHHYPFQPAAVHIHPYHTKITCEEEDLLFAIYKDDIEKVEQLLGWDCSDWKPMLSHSEQGSVDVSAFMQF